MVLDLPGDEGVWVGLALAARGYRPVPVYNALPYPTARAGPDSISHAPSVAVNLLPIMNALHSGADQLAKLNIPKDTPPVFLLDANRHGEVEQIAPDKFDNRSVCFTTDFPSASFLISRGIRKILLVQLERVEPQADVEQVIYDWQIGGLLIESIRIDSPSERLQFRIRRPSWFGAILQKALAALGLRRVSGDDHAAWMHDSSTGG
ncbi:hypothetical protein GC207_08355 [bacterium]|nr:hypothetical protein [bacterium]